MVRLWNPRENSTLCSSFRRSHDAQRNRRSIPSYRRHKARGLAVVTIDGCDVYLGPYGTSESKSAYDRTIAEWLTNGRTGLSVAPDENAFTITELIAAYWRHARANYVKDGQFVWLLQFTH